ncbi:MAG: hypothetical protein VR64_00545 [Desulfatitalea sp. BRH_c12]|nr:MAG: hypothetical protein VR64_00545 [Desulfatitalea sp. BRH_c12]
MAQLKTHIGLSRPILAGFMAGFLSTLTFHQLTLWALWRFGLAPSAPYVMTAVPPFGIPAVLSLAFWGGVWGIAFALILRSFPRIRYWLFAFLFGAILPSMVAFLIVFPLKGIPMGWQLPLLMRVFLLNGMWGLGTGVFLKWLLAGMGYRRASHCPPGAICES